MKKHLTLRPIAITLSMLLILSQPLYANTVTINLPLQNLTPINPTQTKLGEVAGIDPRISQLAGIPISAGISSSLYNASNPTNPINPITSMTQGLLKGVTSVALDYGFDSAGLNAWQGALISRTITGALQGNPITGLTSSLTNTLTLGLGNTNYNSLSSWGKAAYITKIQDFSKIANKQGIANALETYATSIFQRDSVEYIVNKFGSITDAILSKNNNQLPKDKLKLNLSNESKNLKVLYKDDTLTIQEGSTTKTLNLKDKQNITQTTTIINKDNTKITATSDTNGLKKVQIFDKDGKLQTIIAAPDDYYLEFMEDGKLKETLVEVDSNTEIDGLKLKTKLKIDDKGNEQLLSHEFLGDESKLSVLKDIATGVDSSTGNKLTFGERVAKGVDAFGEYNFGFTKPLTANIGAGITAEAFNKLGINKDDLSKAITNFQNKGKEYKEQINTFLRERKAENKNWEILDAVVEFKARIGTGAAMEISIGNNQTKGLDAFVGAKLGIIANGEFGDIVELGGQIKVNYGSAHGELGTFLEKNIFTNKKWMLSPKTSAGISRVTVDQDKNITLHLKFHRGLFGAEAKIDIPKASELIVNKIQEYSSKILEFMRR